jgi:hypothetical protein
MFGRPRSTNFGFVLSKLPLSPERISSYGALNMSAAARPDSACDRAQFLAVADIKGRVRLRCGTAGLPQPDVGRLDDCGTIQRDERLKIRPRGRQAEFPARYHRRRFRPTRSRIAPKRAPADHSATRC